MPVEREAMVLEARNRAGDYFRNGYNCAEAVFMAFQPYVAPGADPQLVRMFTGFGGGLGHAGCICGALTGSVAVLGLLKGRTDNHGSRETIYNLARAFHDRFEAVLGATCCRSLNPHPFDTPEHLRNCLKITGNTGRLLMEFLLDNGLLDNSVPA